MTIRAKVLLFAAVSVVLVSIMGGSLVYRAHQGQVLRQRLVALQERVDGYDRLRVLAWPFLNQLAQARQQGSDTTLVQRELMGGVDAELERLSDSLTREENGTPGVSELQREHRELRSNLHAWSRMAELRIQQLPVRASVEPTVTWLLYTEFDQSVGRRILEVQTRERAALQALREQMDQNVRHSHQAALFYPLLCLVLVVALASAILAPLRRSLQELTSVAERVGRGDFDVHTTLKGSDELGLLGRAFDRMAHELRHSLEEKQRLVRAEAETSEREARRYSALLEDTVRARTAELGQTNTRLQDSLQQLQAAQEQLLSADRLASVGRLAAGVGHEINNPLAFVLSNLRYVHQELTELEGAPREEARQEMIQALAEATEGAERVRLIVQDLRTLARPDDMVLGPVSVAEVVRASAKMARHETRDRARLVEECEGAPPVNANAARLGQVFLNLFINAAHAISPGRAQDNEIRVRAYASSPHQVTVEVRDTGSGIPPENLRRIFDPFFTTKPVGVGTGLGLSVCHRIITALGGDIRAESEPGRGTCFFIVLPTPPGSERSAA